MGAMAVAFGGAEAEAEAEAEAQAEAEAPPTSPLVGSIAAARMLGAQEAQWSRPPRRLCTLWPQVSAPSLSNAHVHVTMSTM